jgi:hypothetical protein
MKGVPGRAAAGHAWLRPGFADLLGVFLVVLVALIGGRRLFGDADAATHVATGSWILEHRQIPRVDPFSATRAGTAWFAHEWLADVGSALLYRACGWNGLVAAAALLIALTHVLLFRFLVRRGDDVLVAFGAVVAAAATASSHWLARPHLLTVLFLVLFTVTLEQVVHGRWGRRALLLIPPLALLWANVHGGFLVAFGVLGCYGLGVVPAFRESRPRGAGPSGAGGLLLPLAGTFVAAGAAVLVNPWGWRLPRHLLAFFAVHGPALKATSEFAPVAVDDRAGVALLVFAGLCATGIVCGLRAAVPEGSGGPAPAKPRAHALFGPFHPGTLFSLALTTVMALASIRHVEVMAIFGAIIISGGLSAFLRTRVDVEARAQLAALCAREQRSGGALFVSALIGVWVLALGGFLPRAGFDRSQFPVSAVSALKQDGPAPAGPVFAPDVWGGYLILEWPQAHVFVDGRWDMYGDEFFERYADIYLARTGWSETLVSMGVTLAILPRAAPLVNAMQGSRDWVRWRADETAVVFRLRPESQGS